MALKQAVWEMIKLPRQGELNLSKMHRETIACEGLTVGKAAINLAIYCSIDDLDELRYLLI